MPETVFVLQLQHIVRQVNGPVEIVHIEFFRAELEEAISIKPDRQNAVVDARNEVLSNIEFRVKNQERTFCVGKSATVITMMVTNEIELPMYF